MKQYIKPEQEIVESKSESLLISGTGIPVGTPGANPGSALTHAFNGLIYDDEEDEDELGL